LAHLEACPPCTALLRAYQTLSEGTHDAEVEPPMSLSEAVMARIKASQPLAAVALVGTRPKRSHMRRFLAAAALFVVVGVIGFYGVLQGNQAGGEAPVMPLAASAPAPVMASPSLYAPRMAEQPAELGGGAYEEVQPEAAWLPPAQHNFADTAPPTSGRSALEEDNRYIGLFGREDCFERATDLTFFELFLMGETYWLWSDFVEELYEAGYYDLLEREGDTFTVEDPYNPHGYLYGMLDDHPDLLGEEMVIMIGFHLECKNRRVEVRVDEDGELVYYYAVRRPNKDGLRTESYEDLKRVILLGHVLG